jgi:serine/threonine-protein kinase RsbW
MQLEKPVRDTHPVRSAVGSGGELESLRSAFRRQARVIDTLTEAVATLRRGACALKADNADLRAENARLRNHRRGRVGAGANDYLAEVSLPLDVHAPGAARSVIARCLHDRLDTGAVARAQLLISGLVSNSVRHSGASPTQAVVIRFGLTDTALRLEVEDPGEAAAIAVRAPDMAHGGGFGLNIVQTLSARWGVEPTARGGTRVWAQLWSHAADSAARPPA